MYHHYNIHIYISIYTHGSVGKYISLCTRRYCKFVFRFITRKKNKNPRILVLLKHLIEDASYLPRTTNIVFGFPISAFIRLIDIQSALYIFIK